MAWQRALNLQCRQCGKRATQEVLNCKNSSHGYFCLSCASKMVKELDKLEEHERSALRARLPPR